jgi:hypothetical protein
VNKKSDGVYYKRAREFSIRGKEQELIEKKNDWLNNLENFKGKNIIRGKLNNTLGNYYISLEIGVDENTEPIEDGDELLISFYVGFIPADEKTYENTLNYADLEITNGVYENILRAGITFDVNNGSYSNLNFYYDNHVGNFVFEEIRDYKIFKNRFVNDIKNKFKDDIDEFIAGLGIGTDYGIDFTNIYDFMRNYNVNELIY